MDIDSFNAGAIAQREKDLELFNAWAADLSLPFWSPRIEKWHEFGVTFPDFLRDSPLAQHRTVADSYVGALTNRFFNLLEICKMNPVIAHLNAVIEGRMPTAIKPPAAAQALHVMEYANLAIGALRILAENPDSDEGKAHAKRAIDLFDDEVQRQLERHAPKATEIAADTAVGAAAVAGEAALPAAAAAAVVLDDDAHDLV